MENEKKNLINSFFSQKMSSSFHFSLSLSKPLKILTWTLKKN